MGTAHGHILVVDDDPDILTASPRKFRICWKNTASMPFFSI